MGTSYTLVNACILSLYPSLLFQNKTLRKFWYFFQRIDLWRWYQWGHWDGSGPWKHWVHFDPDSNWGQFSASKWRHIFFFEVQSNLVKTNRSWPTIFVLYYRAHYNSGNLCTKLTNLMLKSLRYNSVFVVTEFVINKFHCIFRCHLTFCSYAPKNAFNFTWLWNFSCQSLNV